MVKKDFAFGHRLSDISKTPEQLMKENYAIRPLPLEKLYPSQDNFYSKDDIRGLAVSISLCGLQHFIQVRPSDETGKHKITDGERRYLAHKLLVEEGEERFNVVMCIISPEESATMTRYRMLSANATNRDKTDADKVKEAQELRLVYEQLRREGVIKRGEIRDYVAAMLHVSKSTVAKYNNIEKNLAPELRKSFDAGKIPISAANELASLPPEEQAIIATGDCAGAIAVQSRKKATPKKERRKKQICIVIEMLEEITAHIYQNPNVDHDMLHERCGQILDMLRNMP